MIMESPKQEKGLQRNVNARRPSGAHSGVYQLAISGSLTPNTYTANNAIKPVNST